ncbi:hypothetical protein ACQP2P_28000 [Dactylosporangium sp. CA-139114]|uniref:hypothetical protein n=1 Tax=Dactylosporangium sp. CA-139114 TaxID=3239931 RepID=UPI003D97FD88
MTSCGAAGHERQRPADPEGADPDLPQPTRLPGWDDRRPPWQSRALRYFASTALARTGRADLQGNLAVGYTPSTPTAKDDIAAALAREDTVVITSHGYDESDLIMHLQTTRSMTREHGLQLVARILRDAGLPQTTPVDVTETGERFWLTDIPEQQSEATNATLGRRQMRARILSVG